MIAAITNTFPMMVETVITPNKIDTVTMNFERKKIYCIKRNLTKIVKRFVYEYSTITRTIGIVISFALYLHFNNLFLELS
ncbi:hypothetical protein BLOT_000247 [Blomia tropicalis]|nr:hypothetical protein BLOT_000247 [Blomia tropicalis]